MNLRRWIRILLLLPALLLAAPAHAALNCTVTATNVAFGTSVSPLNSSPTNANSTFTVTCTAQNNDIRGNVGNTRKATVCVSLDNGSGGSNGTNRRLANGTSYANFDIYQSAAYSTVWGNRTSVAVPVITVTLTDSGGQSQAAATPGTATVTAFGQLFGSQTAVAPNTYSSNFSNEKVEAWWAEFGGARTDCNVGGTLPQSTNTVSFSASVTYVAACSTFTVPNLTFPAQNQLTSTVNGKTTFSVQCSSGTPYKISLNAGTATGATTATRRMTGPGGNTILYMLSKNSFGGPNWGNVAGVDTNDGTGSGVAQSYTIFGQVPIQVTPPLGTYTDTITATLTY
jgi:spore coat protein U-like protein